MKVSLVQATPNPAKMVADIASICYGKLLVSEGAVVPEVMSPWFSRVSAADNSWNSVTYGNGLFVAVAITGTGNRVMTSPDGITWTSRTSAVDNDWRSVTYGNVEC